MAGRSRDKVVEVSVGEFRQIGIRQIFGDRERVDEPLPVERLRASQQRMVVGCVATMIVVFVDQIERVVLDVVDQRRLRSLVGRTEKVNRIAEVHSQETG